MNQVLLIGDQPSGRGGMETIIRTVALHLREKNALAGLFFDARSLDGVIDTAWLEGLPLFPMGRKTSKIIRKQAYIFRLVKLLKQNADIRKIVCLTPNHCRLAYLATKFVSRKIEIISWIHFSIGTYKPREQKNLIRSCDCHLAISSGISEQLINLGANPKSCFLVYNTVEQKKETIKNSINSFSILYVGRVDFMNQKNLKELFCSVAGMPIPWHLHIVGSGVDEEVQKCQRYAESLNIAQNVSWHGWQENPWEYVRRKIQQVSCFVLSSKHEGFPMVLLEAMSYGIPCVSSNCPTGPNDIIENGKNGYLYENKVHGSENLLRALIQLYENEGSLDSQKIKDSISPFYLDKYLGRLDKILLS